MRGRCTPLQVVDSLLYLGVPLAHNVSDEMLLSAALRKTSNTFFAFKKLLDHPQTPLKVKWLVFDRYVTSRWQWCSPILFPTKRMLRNLEAMKNTLLLSILKVPTDPFQDWVTNQISRRRVVRVVCHRTQGPQWTVTWLRRFWKYWGHLARSQVETPSTELFKACSCWGVAAGSTRAGWLTDCTQRKIQRIWGNIRAQLPRPEEYPAMWEHLAQVRHQWQATEACWQNYWAPPAAQEDSPWLLNKQIVLIENSHYLLRPSRAPPLYYYNGVVSVQPWQQKGAREWQLWAEMGARDFRVVIAKPNASPAAMTVMAARSDTPEGDRVETIAKAWLFLFKCMSALPEHESRDLVVPATWFLRPLFQEQVSLAQYATAARMLSFESRLGMVLENCCLPPKTLPKAIEEVLPIRHAQWQWHGSTLLEVMPSTNNARRV